MTSVGPDSTSGTGHSTEIELEWICPYCGESKTDRYAREDGEGHAVAALRAHIVSATSEGHGPENERPDDSERTLFEYVSRADGRR